MARPSRSRRRIRRDRERASRYPAWADEIHVLGPLEVVGAAGPRQVGGPRERALLAALAVFPGQALTVDRLTDALWSGDAPLANGKAVQNVVLRLRKVLGPAVIETRSGAYALSADPSAIDALEFERRVAEGRSWRGVGD